VCQVNPFFLKVKEIINQLIILFNSKFYPNSLKQFFSWIIPLFLVKNIFYKIIKFISWSISIKRGFILCYKFITL